MARLLMGAIVTKAVGKIGGQCFRIKNQTQILQRNPNPFKNRAINKNPAMYKIRYVFHSWRDVSAYNKNLWAIIAANNPQPNRFGNMVTLSARDYYNQANINIRLAGGSDVPPSSYDAQVPYFNFSNIIVNTNLGLISLIDLENNDNCRAVVCIRQVSNGGVNPTASSLPQVTNFDIEYYDAETLYFECNAAGFNFYPDNWYAFGIRIISLYGVPSPWIQYTVQAI